MNRIEAAIADSERRHRGEICFAVESCLDAGPLWRNQPARERALDVFSLLRVWDTPDNNGVLLYLLLADRDIEIVADRGIGARVGDAEPWQKICRSMETRLRQGNYEQAVLSGLASITELLVEHYPRSAEDGEPDENDRLPNRPVIL